MLKRFFIIWILCSPFSVHAAASPGKVRTLYNSLDPLSVSQHLAFYQLYSEFPEGQKALQDASSLLSNNQLTAEQQLVGNSDLSSSVQSIVALVNKQPDEAIPEISDQELYQINLLASTLPHYNLKGHHVLNEQEVIALPVHEIDLARGLFLTQMGADNLKKIQTYEAMIDLMALQIRARLPKNASPAITIRTINDFVFGEMGFRFPPHSAYAKDIDIYTFLPSVLDSRRGVCLGVSILYICLAQRLGMNLEMITPPGHIYVRYRSGDHVINIETTARGMHIDSEEYLGVETRSLQQRNIKEVIGLAHFNQASVYWQKDDYAKALASYEKAEVYLQDDMLLKELKGYALVLSGKKPEGVALLEQVRGHVPDHAVSGDEMSNDFIMGNVNEEGIKAIFKTVDETRESIIAKRDLLVGILEKYPKFKTGIFALAVTWIQLHRAGEALRVLERYHELEKSDPTAEYYLTMLYAQRFDYNKAWEHLRNAESILQSRQHTAKQLKAVRRELALHAPE